MSGEGFTVSILLNGEYKAIKFRIQEGVTVESVENRVRSTCGVVNGTLSYSEDEIEVVASLTAGGVYHFVGFQVPAQTVLSKTHSIKVFDKKIVTFKMTFENSNSSIMEQLCEFINNNNSILQLQNVKRGTFSIDGFVLVDESSVIIADFGSLPGEESQLTLYVPDKIQPLSGSDWTPQYLKQLKIDFSVITADEFCNSHEMSPTASELIITLSPVEANHYMSYPKRNSSLEDFQAAREKQFLQHPICKALYLIEKFSMRESIVDSFLQLLLYELGFFSGMLYLFPQLDLPLFFGETKCSAIADFGVMDVISFYRMLIVEDKSLLNKVVNSEPQLLAEAIAAYQRNNCEKFGGSKRKAQDNLQTLKGNDGENISDDSSNIIYGMRLNGFLFSFYEIPITNSILNAMETLKSTQAQTIVKKTEYLNFLDPQERVSIIRTLDYLKSKLIDEGSKSKRKISVTNL